MYLLLKWKCSFHLGNICLCSPKLLPFPLISYNTLSTYKLTQQWQYQHGTIQNVLALTGALEVRICECPCHYALANSRSLLRSSREFQKAWKRLRDLHNIKTGVHNISTSDSAHLWGRWQRDIVDRGHLDGEDDSLEKWVHNQSKQASKQATQTPDVMDGGHLDGEDDSLEKWVLNQSCSYHQVQICLKIYIWAAHKNLCSTCSLFMLTGLFLEVGQFGDSS